MFIPIFSNPSSHYFFGKWKNGKISGNGKMFRENRDVYGGNWEEGLPKWNTSFKWLNTCMLNERLIEFVNLDLLDVKAHEKFLSLRKSTRKDVATVLEEELHHARSTFKQA